MGGGSRDDGFGGVGGRGRVLGEVGVRWGLGIFFLFQVGCGGFVGAVAVVVAASVLDVNDLGALGHGIIGLLFEPDVAFGPFARWRVWTGEEHGYCNGRNDDEGNHVGDTPGFVRSQALSVDEGVVDGGHDEAGVILSQSKNPIVDRLPNRNLLCNSTTRVTKTSRQGAGGADNPFVKEPGTPHLARDKSATQNANKKSQCYQTLRIRNKASQGCGNSTDQQ